MADLYLDNDLSSKVATILAEGGHLVWSTRNLGFQRATDDQQLLLAARGGWTIVTHNEEDFLLLHLAWIRWARAWAVSPTPLHGGILIVPQDEDAAVAAAIDRHLKSATTLPNELYRWRVRRGWQCWEMDRGWLPYSSP